MVLAEFGGCILSALKHMSNAIVIDKNVLTYCLIEVSQALLAVDVQVSLVTTLQKNVKKIHKQLAYRQNKQCIIQHVHFMHKKLVCVCVCVCVCVGVVVVIVVL